MYSRRLYAKIVGGAVLIVLLSLIGSWLLITRLSFFLSFVCLLFILLITLFIIRLATRLNYKLSVFFEAMRNEDTTQHFPANPDDPFTNALYADMNHILRQLGVKRWYESRKAVRFFTWLLITSSPSRCRDMEVRSRCFNRSAEREAIGVTELRISCVITRRILS